MKFKKRHQHLHNPWGLFRSFLLYLESMGTSHTPIILKVPFLLPLCENMFILVSKQVWRSGAWHKDLNLKVEATCDDDDDDDSRNNNNNSSHYGDYSPANADYLGTGLSRALDRGLALSTPNRSGGF
jgi:hypothetical protein